MIFHIHSEYPILRHTRAALGSGCQPILDRACRTTSGTGAWAHGSQDRDMSSQDSLTPSLLVWESSFKIRQCFFLPCTNHFALYPSHVIGSNMKEHLMQTDGLHDIRKSERLVYGFKKQSSHGVVPLPGSVSSCRRFAAMILGCFVMSVSLVAFPSFSIASRFWFVKITDKFCLMMMSYAYSGWLPTLGQHHPTSLF